MRSRFAMTLLTAGLTALAVAVVVSAQSASPAASANDSLLAALAGKNEVSPKGDKNGRGSFAATFDGRRLCYGYSVKNIGKPVAAHLHSAPAGKNGVARVELKLPKSGDPGSVSGCMKIPADVRDDILRRPKGYYVNVHTAEFPNGAVRGQLSAKSP